MAPRIECSSRVLSLLAMVAPTLLPYKLELGERVTVYNPQRVLKQFLMTRSSEVRGDTSFSNVLIVEIRIMGQGIAKILPSLKRIFATD